ncbi:MAG TPA: endonuclease/exonuclease/phosphatase family protein [Blastocatellia bacterium]|nr:endonuclease/exonuclease/phosphatase family protein [Blastocatellia bacterium]
MIGSKALTSRAPAHAYIPEPSRPLIKLLACLAVFLSLAFAHGGLATPSAAKRTIRVMTYNIHHGEGADGRLDLNRIAEVILSQRADIVALQEVDRGVERTARRDIIAELAALTGMNYAFGKNIDYQGGDYGNAVLTRYPILRQENHHYKMMRQGEQRGLLQVVLKADGKQLLLLNTHLDYRRDDAERLSNVDEIRQIRERYKGLPAILCGDLNDTPGSRTHRKLEEILVDAWARIGKGEGFSYPSTQPQKRIDYVLVSKGKAFAPAGAWVVESPASDHLPVVVELKLT